MRRVSLLALLASCTGGTADVTPPEGTPPVSGGPKDTLVVAMAGDIDSLNPVVSASAADSQVMQQIYANLVESDFDCSLKKLPGVATEWAWSEDGKTLSMTLDPSYTWYDGTKVTPEDLAFTYQLIGDKDVATPRAEYTTRMVEGARPKIIDATHIEWQFTEAYDRDTQISHVSLGILPKHVLEKADRATLKGDKFSKEPLVNGPFKIATYEPAQRLVLEPNEKFTGPESMKPQLGRVIYRILPDYSTRLLEMQSGTVDMMEQLYPPDADELVSKNPNVNIVKRGWRSMDYVAWNLTNPLFADKRVRQALAMSVDVEGIIGKMLTLKNGEPVARPAIGTITPELCAAYNEDVKPFPFDASKAKAMFADAGWTDSNGDGVLDKDGKKFTFTLMTNSENKRRGEAAVRLQAHFKDVGVEMNIERVEFNAMTEHLRGREFEAVLGGWSAALFVDPSDMWRSDRPGHKSELNYTGYSNPKADELIDLGLKTPETEKAAPHWRELQAVLYDDQPYLFLWWTNELVAIDKRFENVHINVLSNFHRLYDWSVPPDKVKYPVK
jgi:peptide/nickel transport system substrate-binding protein